MKNFLLILLLAGILPLNGLSRSGEIARIHAANNLQEQITKAVQEAHFTIEVNRALPMRGGFISLSYPYTLSVYDDVLTADLPYSGLSQPLCCKKESIQIAEPIKIYTVKYDKHKGVYRIACEVCTPKDMYKVSIEIAVNGYCWITINPAKAELISYTGTIIFKQNK